MTLSSQQTRALVAIIDEVREGNPPILSRVARRGEMSRPSARAAVDGLIRKGYVRQPYSQGPYIPTRTPEGVGLELRLVEVAAEENP